MTEKYTEERVSLQGADKFMLALAKHEQVPGATGIMCHYIMDCDTKVDLEMLRIRVEQNDWFSRCAAYNLADLRRNHNRWLNSGTRQIPVHETTCDETIPSYLRTLQPDVYRDPLIHLTVIHRSSGSSAVALSWHHLLFDAYGALLLLKSLNGDLEPITRRRQRSPFSGKVFMAMYRVKRFISRSARKPVAKLERNFAKEVKPHSALLTFNDEESRKLDQNALSNGARFGPANYLLACTASVVKEIKQDSLTKGDFWIPLPQDMRKKGSREIPGNHLSSLFYRIPESTLNAIPDAVQALNDQMTKQIKSGFPQAYAHLQNYLRILPPGLYLKLINGPNGRSLATFLFTFGTAHPAELDTFLEYKVTGVVSVPPNPYPPGLTFSCQQFQGKWQILILTYGHLFSEKELDAFKKRLRQAVLEGN